MKKCYTCQQDKAVLEFNKNKSRKDGLNSICRECSKTRSKQYYRENAKEHKLAVMERSKKQKQQNRQLRWDYLLTHPCVDCGEADRVVLEFDHLRDKKNCISVMVWAGNSTKTLKEEIEKCEVRCANCHKRKTTKDQGYYRNLLTTPQSNDIL